MRVSKSKTWTNSLTPTANIYSFSTCVLRAVHAVPLLRLIARARACEFARRWCSRFPKPSNSPDVDRERGETERRRHQRTNHQPPLPPLTPTPKRRGGGDTLGSRPRRIRFAWSACGLGALAWTLDFPVGHWPRDRRSPNSTSHERHGEPSRERKFRVHDSPPFESRVRSFFFVIVRVRAPSSLSYVSGRAAARPPGAPPDGLTRRRRRRGHIRPPLSFTQRQLRCGCSCVSSARSGWC